MCMRDIQKFIFLLTACIGYELGYGQDITNKGNTIRILNNTSIHVTNGGYINDTKLGTASEDPQLILLGTGSVFSLTGNFISTFSPDIIDVSNLIFSEGSVNFNGVNPHTISGASPLLTMPNVIVNGSLILQRDVVIRNTLKLNGSLNLGNYKIDLTPNSGNIISETSTNRIFTSGTGTVNYTLSSTPSSITQNLDGIGLGLNGTISAGAKIIRGHVQQTTVSSGSVFRYFDVQPNGGTVNGLRFYYFDVEIPGTINESDLLVYVSEDGGTNWEKIGGTINTVANTIDVTGLSRTANMRVTIAGKDCSVLPIVNLGSSTQDFCAGAAVTLDAGTDGIFYTWSTAESSQKIVTSTAGLYSVVVRNAKGCEGTGSVTLIERPIPSASFITNIPCPGQAVNFTNSSSIASGTITYNWDFGDPTSTTDYCNIRL
jgi:hypothetical protein